MADYFVSISEVLASLWPVEEIDLPEIAVLDEIRFCPTDLKYDALSGIGFDTRIMINHGLEIRLPNFNQVFLSIGGSSDPIGLKCDLHPAPGITVGPLPVRVNLRNDLLIPVTKIVENGKVTGFERDGTTDHLSVRIDGALLGYSYESGLRIGSQFTISLPLVKIGNTDLVIGVEEATFIMTEGQLDPTVLNLGFDAGFRGIYAREAVLYWLPELRLNGLDVPGLRMEFEDIALGNEGISFDLGLSWLVEYDEEGNFVEEGTELLGFLFFEDWQIALDSATGSVRRNIPQGLSVRSFLRVPFFKAVFSAYFSLAYNSDDPDDPRYKTVIQIAKESPGSIDVAYGGAALSVQSFNAGGWLSHEGFSINGQCGFEADLYGFSLAVEDGAFEYTHYEKSEAFDFGLTNVVLGDLGQVDQARLILRAERDENGELGLRRVEIMAGYSWEDLKWLIPADMQEVVDLPDNGRIEASVIWVQTDRNDSSAIKVVVDLKAEVSHLDDLWKFVPQAYRPEVRSVRSVFRITYDSVEKFNEGGGSATPAEREGVNIELTAIMEIKLPDPNHFNLPGFDLIDVHTGDEEGFISAEFKAQYTSGLREEEAFNAGIILQNPFSADIWLPGIQGEQPFIENSIRQVGLQFNAADGEEESIGGKLFLEGDFQFRPVAPQDFPFASHFNTLMRNVGLDEIVGNSSMSLIFTDESFDFELNGTFEQLGIEIDVFQMLSALSLSDETPGGKEIDIDFDIGFYLKGFEFKVGLLPGSAGSEERFYFSFDLTVECTMTGLPPVKATLTLSSEEFSFGIEDLTIPVEVPLYPIDLTDLQRLEGNDGIWSKQKKEEYAAEIDIDIGTLDAAIEIRQDPAFQFELIKDKAHLELKKLLLEIIMAVQERVAESGRPVYQGLVMADTWAHSVVLGLLHFDTQLKLNFPEIKFRIPFDNPGGISLSGSGKLIGFAEDDPFKALEDYTFTLGLSAQYIFAKIESGGAPVPIPAFGTKYDDGTVSVSRFMIGYGYSKNSFAVDFAGEVVVPSELQKDADTSEELGFGIRPPRYNKLAFKLDVIPVSIGKVTVLVPLPQFDIDLRSPQAPPLLSAAGCVPYWDGLEVIVKNAFHGDFKRLAFSPFFGFAPVPNLKFDGDLQLGNQQEGLTLIVDDLLVLFGLLAGTTGIYPIPFIADPTQPYFQNICGKLSVQGWHINFNLQRPFPSASPLALIEAFGLISDPTMKIDPEGALAGIIRFSLTDAYLQVPDFVLQLFPEAAAITGKRYHFTLNLGTLITAVQGIIRASQPVIDALSELSESADAGIDDLLNNLPDSFDPWVLVSLLPPELRKFRMGGRIAGFEASACLVIATAEEAAASLNAKKSREKSEAPALQFSEGKILQIPAADGSILYEGSFGKVADESLQGNGFDVNHPASSLEAKRLIRKDESLGLFRGMEFKKFDENDLTLIPTGLLEGETAKGAGIFIGAYVKVFEGQRFRFLGKLFPDGSFALISEAEARPLHLIVFGIPVRIPFEGYGRLKMAGRQRKNGYRGFVSAEGYFRWAPVPNIIAFEAGSKKKPAVLKLYSNGKFELSANARITLFHGAGGIKGSVFVSQENARFEGRLRYRPGNALGAGYRFRDILELDVAGAGSISGPAKYEFSGRGDVKLLGRTFTKVEVFVNERFASFDLLFHKSLKDELGGFEQLFPILGACEILLRASSRINIRRTRRPEFQVLGEGQLRIFGAVIDGRGGIRSLPAKGGRLESDFFEAFMEGNLYWQGRRWLGGSIRIGSRGLRIAGSTSFGLEITPSKIPGGHVEIAHLFLEISLEGHFELDAQRQNMKFFFKGHWTLGLGMADTGNEQNKQLLPLSSGSITFDSNISNELPLFRIEHFRHLPFAANSISIPVPIVSVTSAEGAKTLIKSGRVEYTKLNGDTATRGAVEFWTPAGRIGLEGTIPPIPFINEDKTWSHVRAAYSAYDIDLDWTNVTLDLNELSNLSIALTLDDDEANYFPLKLKLTAGSSSKEVTF